ncbi:hypothetical protein ERO13_A05G192900v2 [Gossypium hirsutum]|nr:hypothetical protein ERO13_A05G192900v2 [Gossypium hirsutum]
MAPAYSSYLRMFVMALFMFVLASSRVGALVTSTAILVRVDQSGKGDYRKIQDAIDAVPSDNKEPVFILVKPGIYQEKIVVPADKPFITISGLKANGTIITWNDGGEIFESPTFTVLASDFVARYLTIQNTLGARTKAVALRVSGDRAAFFGCRILAYQDTLLADNGRHYYKNCYIEGAVDFICGNAASLFEVIKLRNIKVPFTFTLKGDASITAQRRESPSEDTGFTFLGCKITGVRSALLGRPWGAYSRVVFALSYMSGAILPQGWDDWGDTSKQSTTFYREYKCYGPGANARKRVEWSGKLTTEEAEFFMTKNMIGGRSWIRSTPTHFKKASTATSNNPATHA